MTAFRYRAVDDAGKEIAGVVEAETARVARGQLRERGLFPVEVETVTAGGPGRARRVREGDLALLTRQWSTLLASGLTAEQALAALIDQAESDAIRQTLAGVRSEVMAGYSLKVALDRYPLSFPPIYRASVAAGEKSGQLGTVMLELADYLERRGELRRKTIQAMVYPVLVAAVATIVIVALMVYVVPQVVAVFQQGRQSLPLLTRVMIAASDFLRAWGWLLLAALAGGGWAFRLALRGEAFRRRVHGRLLALPLVGRHLRTLEATRFASTLAILVGSGVPLLAALDAGREVLALLPLKDAVAAAAEQVRQGVPLSKALARTGRMPPLLVHMIASGEATGRLDEMLGRAARLQQGELENRTALLTSLLEPALLLTMGGFVLLIVLAVMQPIIEINHLFK